MVRMRWCSLLSKGFILNVCSVGGGLVDNCIVKILPGPALSLLQMWNVHLAHYAVHSILHSLKKLIQLQFQMSRNNLTLYQCHFALSAPLLVFGKREHKLLLLCLDNTPKTCTVDPVSSHSCSLPCLCGNYSFSAERELLGKSAAGRH